MSRLSLHRLPTPPGLAEEVPGAHVYRLGECSVIVSRERVDRDDMVFTKRWHISIAHTRRYPTWDEIGQARDRLIPADVWMCMAHPPREYWLNYHPNCLHLWEIRDRSLIAQWRHEGELARAVGKGTPTGSRPTGRP